jgi:hypothetical protein
MAFQLQATVSLPASCEQCGRLIDDLRRGQTRYVVAGGQTLGPEFFVHFDCRHLFEALRPLPRGQSWGWLPLAPLSRQRTLRAFEDIARSLRRRRIVRAEE